MKLRLKLNNNNDVYYNCNKFYSYDAFMGMIDGGRGIGKTTTFEIKGIQINNKGGEWIYLRRYKPEIKKFVTKDSLSKVIDGVVYKGDGAGGYTVLVEDQILGYCIALSTARSYKSVDFSKVELIIFDEAFVKKSSSYRYLDDEVITLLEFISTVQRTRTNLRVVILSNNEDQFNPYANFFDLPIFETLYYDKDRKLYCEHAKNSPKLMELEKKTGLFALIKGTAYADYHYDNKVLNNEKDVNIISKPPNAKLVYRVILYKQTLNVYTYYDKEEQYMYCENKRKIINDNITYDILQNGRTNYLHVNTFKKKLLNFTYRFYFNKKASYSSERAYAMMSWLMEEM